MNLNLNLDVSILSKFQTIKFEFHAWKNEKNTKVTSNLQNDKNKNSTKSQKTKSNLIRILINGIVNCIHEWIIISVSARTRSSRVLLWVKSGRWSLMVVCEFNFRDVEQYRKTSIFSKRNEEKNNGLISWEKNENGRNEAF